MAFITGQTNRRLSNKEPAEYLPGIVEAQGEAALVTQGLPLDPRLHKMENYREFLAARREILAAWMNAFISKSAGLKNGVEHSELPGRTRDVAPDSSAVIGI